jgi:phosphoribosylformylglycinamidine synthase
MPDRPEGRWRLLEAVRGLRDAAKALGVIIVDGGIDTAGRSNSAGSPAGDSSDRPPVARTVVLGILDAGRWEPRPTAWGRGESVALLGPTVPGLTGSVYVAHAGVAPDDRPPPLDLEMEARLHAVLLGASRSGIARAVRTVDRGGLAIAVAGCAIEAGVGAELSVGVASAPAVDLFGEAPSRAVVTAARRDAPRLEALSSEHGVPLRWLGETGGDRLVIRLAGEGATGAAEERGASVADAVDEPLGALRDAWERGFARALGLDGPDGLTDASVGAPREPDPGWSSHPEAPLRSGHAG